MELPYPPQEFSRRPTTAEEALQMELRTFGESPNALRLDALSLEKLYGNSSLAIHFKKASRYMSAVRVDTGACSLPDEHNFFYIGSLMMMHAHGQLLPSDMRQIFFSSDRGDQHEKDNFATDQEYRAHLADKYRTDFYYIKSRLYRIPDTDPELHEVIDVISGQLTHGSSSERDADMCAEGMLYSNDMLDELAAQLWQRFTRS